MAKIINSIILKKIFKILLVSLFAFSCIQAPNNKRLSTTSGNVTTTTTTTTNLPTFKDGLNYFQNGATIYTSVLSLELDFADSFYYRGKDVDSYIRNINPSGTLCLVTRYLQSGVNKAVVLALVPKSTYNYTNQSIEYYYSTAPADDTSNQNYCLKTALVNKLFALYPTLTPIYKIKSLCASGICLSTGYVSEKISLFTPSGVEVINISTTGQYFSLKNAVVTNPTAGSTCVTNAECKNQGYDCCSGNQCVKDLQAKTISNPLDPDYKQALQDILNNPSTIYNFPQYYYICSTNVNTPTSGTTGTETTVVNAAQKRVDLLASYYNCVNKVHGESGRCTTTIPNASVGVVNSIAADDRSFSSTFTNANIDVNTLVSIEKIVYGDITLYDYTTKTEAELANSVFTDTYLTLNGQHNDDMTTGATIKLNASVPGAASKDLVITYKNDASCIYVNSTLAKCEKYYTQGQTSFGATNSLKRMGRITDHYPASNLFNLPSYANTTKAIKVEIDGIQIIEGTDFDVVNGSPSHIELYPNTNSSLRAIDSQIVKITFFAPIAVMASKLAALEAIKTACSCSDYTCNLAPAKNNSGTITDYVCVYPTNNNVIVPLSQKVYLSSKSVPVRFYDNHGAAQSTVTADANQSELVPAFAYTGNDLAKPNNLTSYIGFNEIYGSLSYVANSAKPPKMIDVKKGNSYDIFVDNGSYYSCAQCGADYYSQISKLFPSMQFGGGMVPMQFQTNRVATNSSMIRSDDFHFGRACFVPASMLPWSHFVSSDVQTQRTNRMSTQHFLFSNGYQRDWYGFDYGSVIGSFDGVKWFSIGSNRRIKADSSKLFIAINGYMGDLAIESTYTVSINDSTLNPSGAGMVLNDLNSDGAECQKYHQCSTDNDCYATLGADYVCSAVTDITTTWPVFDVNATEIPDTTAQNSQLTNILGLSNPGKRCIYRGRGSLCTANYNTVNLNSTFNKTTAYDFHACSVNNYCQSFSANGANVSKFNNRINRLGKIVSDSNKDSFGLGAQVTLRPLDFLGQEEIRSIAQHNLSGNKATSMCIPGRSPETNNFVSANNTIPDNNYYPGDRVVGIGQTLLKLASADLNYLSSCNVFDSSTSNYYYKTSANPLSSNNTNTALIYDAGSQNLPTNSLEIFRKSLFVAKGLTFNLLTPNANSILSTMAYQINTCLRAPGASCNTDLECGPSKVLTDKTKLLNAGDSTLTSILNPYEIKFWQEPLICSQAAEKTSTTYDPKNNKCCRDVGSVISIGQNTLDATSAGNNLKTSSVPGINTALNDPLRYSRVSTIYKEMKTDGLNYPALKAPAVDQCATFGCFDYAQLTNQYKTFSLLANKTSCTNSWVRSFTDGTHDWSKWVSAKKNAINVDMFKCYNFGPNGTGGFKCTDNENDDECKFVQNSPTGAKAKAVMKFIGKLNLLGIPQVALPNELDSISLNETDLACRSNPSNQSLAYPGDDIATATNYLPPLLLWKNFNLSNMSTYPVGATSAREIQDTVTGKFYYSAGDPSNFNDAYRSIFKSDEVVACKPAGSVVASVSDANLCCTGFVNAKNAASIKCALPDFADISIYTNKFVSSEGSALNVNFFDEDGYIKDPNNVAQLACAKSMCASSKVAFGVLVSQLKIPGLDAAQGNKYFRFLQGDSATDDANGLLTLFNQGLKLNNHAYCLPAAANVGSGGDVTVFSCQ